MSASNGDASGKKVAFILAATNMEFVALVAPLLPGEAKGRGENFCCGAGQSNGARREVRIILVAIQAGLLGASGGVGAARGRGDWLFCQAAAAAHRGGDGIWRWHADLGTFL